MTDDLPFVIGYDVISQIAGHEILAHWHTVLEFFYIEEGEILFSCEGGSRLMQRGQGIIINSNVLHAYHKTEGQDCRYLVLNFHPSLLGEKENNVIEKRYIHPFIHGEKEFHELYLSAEHPSQKSMIQKMYEILEVWEKKEEGYELMIQSQLLQMWHLLYMTELRFLPDARQENIKMQCIQKAVRFIRENYTEKITLKEIAGHCNISETVCWRLFRSQLDQSPIEYVIKYRIQMSLELLGDPCLPITQVASRSGFDSHSYYSKVFKKVMGCTPQAYRKIIDKRT
ncbi:MAG TPA: helix-turn-helix transcriptional regulator [Candidatus Choladousia intestinavium]|uniref:Helix-turn-helix transcriptional regulator n=1 Tax=Candidatus Choladousia intestinavium TaxID=2840727 RepID=A0A9D1D9A3_9FIRM|nr:helix-turn-helix transcriptional regulator [Candidatus Choladousia intestinavium]